MVIRVFLLALAFLLSPANSAALSCAEVLTLAPPTSPRHRNETIENGFAAWLSARDMRYDSLAETEKAAQAKLFLAAQRKILDDHRAVFQTEYLRLMAEKRRAAQAKPRTVRFRGVEYPVVARLGCEREGTVDLIQADQREVVIKYFFEAREGARVDPMLAQVRLFHLATETGVKSAEMLGVDLNQNRAMMLSFEGGLIHDDIGRLRSQGKIGDDVMQAYVVLHAVFFNDMVNAFGEEAAILTGEPQYLSPHLNNVAYVPTTGQFAVFDFN